MPTKTPNAASSIFLCDRDLYIYTLRCFSADVAENFTNQCPDLYLPKLRGRVVPWRSGAEIELVQTLHPLGIAAILGFFLFPLGLCLRDHSYFGVVVVVLILTVFHTILYFVGFIPDAQRSEAYLRNIAS